MTANIKAEKKHLSVRLNEELLYKIRVIAQHEKRSASGQILFLIRNCIEQHEEMYGKIENREE